MNDQKKRYIYRMRSERVLSKRTSVPVEWEVPPPCTWMHSPSRLIKSYCSRCFIEFNLQALAPLPRGPWVELKVPTL